MARVLLDLLRENRLWRWWILRPRVYGILYHFDVIDLVPNYERDIRKTRYGFKILREVVPKSNKENLVPD